MMQQTCLGPRMDFTTKAPFTKPTLLMKERPVLEEVADREAAAEKKESAKWARRKSDQEE